MLRSGFHDFRIIFIFFFSRLFVVVTRIRTNKNTENSLVDGIFVSVDVARNGKNVLHVRAPMMNGMNVYKYPKKIVF